MPQTSSPETVLSAAQIDKARRLLAERRPGHSLPQGLYRDADMHEFDRHAIFHRSWIFAAFEAELPEIGSTYAMTIVGSPILLVRGRDRVVRGFFNSCRHRGAQICTDGHARSARLVCPYHQWTYDLDGRLVGANRMHDGFDKDSHGLVPIPTESVGGIICVALSEEAPDFSPFRDGFARLAVSHDFANLKLVKEQKIVEKANWKLAMENSRECYHCTVGHPELLLSYYDSTMLNYDGSEDSVFRDYEAGLKAMGLDAGPYTGLWYGTSRFPLNPGTESQTLDGKRACAKLIAPANSGVLRFSMQAHSYNYALPDYVFTFSVLPISEQETLMHSKWMVHKDAVEGVDYDLEHLTAVWWITNEQDVSLTENNQRGVNSFGYRPGPYAASTESFLLRFMEFYTQTAESFLGPPPGLKAVRAA